MEAAGVCSEDRQPLHVSGVVVGEDAPVRHPALVDAVQVDAVLKDDLFGGKGRQLISRRQGDLLHWNL